MEELVSQELPESLVIVVTLTARNLTFVFPKTSQHHCALLQISQRVLYTLHSFKQNVFYRGKRSAAASTPGNTPDTRRDKLYRHVYGEAYFYKTRPS